LRNQPARDILVWLLSIAGLVISVSGVVVGWLTLARGRFP
jgi:cytochrome b subunit of formate dehydrogenase